jgi:two-component system sensor histidine kinase KdpD
MSALPAPGTGTRRRNASGGYLLAALVSALATAVAALVERWTGVDDLSLVFMLAVLAVAARTRTGPAVLTAVLCFLAYNFFFIAPRYTFYITASHGVATVTMFLAAALLAGRLAARLAMQVEALREAAVLASARQALAQRLTVAMDETAIAEAVQAVFREHLGAEVWLRQHDDEATTGTSTGASTRAQGASPAQHGWWWLPLRAPDRTLGTLGLKLHGIDDAPDSARRALACTMAEDIAQALIRTRLAAELETQRVTGETERLRNALLSSVSHDLRSPLAGIIGSASSLEHYGARMPEEDRHALLRTIRSEGERLDRYIQNLLDMTRLGHGALTLHRDWVGVDELIGATASRIAACLPDARIETDAMTALAPLWVHPALVEQALFNLVENAVKFSPPDAPVRIGAHDDGEDVIIEVDDAGPGIPEADRVRIFDMFHSVERGDRGRNGTGLGLTIARGMVGAHGGSVDALPGPHGRGTRMRIRLPRIAPAEART